MKIKRLGFITSTRADYGYLLPVMRAAQDKGMTPVVFATGTHFQKKFGFSWKQIVADGFEIAEKIPFKSYADEALELPLNLGMLTASMSKALHRQALDMLLLLGDRGEMLATATAAIHLGIPLGHIHGGDTTFGGGIDDGVRHALSKLSHIHFPASRTSAQRLKRLAESPHRIHAVGDTSIDNLAKPNPEPIEALLARYKLTAPFCILLQHAESLNPSKAAEQMKSTLSVLKKSGLGLLIIQPNIDFGGRAIRAYLNDHIKTATKLTENGNIVIRDNICQNDFFSLLKQATFLIGNSSSGLIEAPYLGVPVIDLGNRQQGRELSANVIHSDFKQKSIKSALAKAQSATFKSKARQLGQRKRRREPASDKIINILRRIDINAKFTTKESP